MQNLDHLEPHNLIPNGVWTLDGLTRYGEQHKQCPYFTSRRMVQLSLLPKHDRVANMVPADAILQRHHLFVPLPARPQDCRAGIQGALERLHCRIRRSPQHR